MRLSSSFLAPSLLGLAGAAAAAAAGSVYMEDVGQAAYTSAAPTLSPDTARLIFAQRLGLSQYHNLKDADEDTIERINDFGGSRHVLFDDDELADDTKHIMVIVEGMKESSALDSVFVLSKFQISNPPSSDANSRLLEDFTRQSEHLSSSHRNTDKHGIPAPVAKLFKSIPENVETRSINGIVFAHIRNAAGKDLSSTLLELAQICGNRWPLTMALMPLSSGSHAKRSANPWGSYEVPKRSAGADRKRPEAILTGPAANTFFDSINDTEEKQPTSPVDGNSPIKGILPACFASKDACESSTNSCSGRGSCIKKYTDKDNNNKECFTCKCTPHVRTNKDGSKKTTYFGGPACSKKDVVMPFWLFAGFGIGMASLLSFGIGMLYSMGNEELPSVIGAGVSGPSARH